MSTKKPVTEFTVVRKRWRRGIEFRNFLRDSSGKQCCLGFLARENGYLAKEIKGVGTLRYLNWRRTEYEPIAFAVCGVSKHLNDMAANLNDSTISTDEDKEEALIRLFGTEGITLNFVD